VHAIARHLIALGGQQVRACGLNYWRRTAGS